MEIVTLNIIVNFGLYIIFTKIKKIEKDLSVERWWKALNKWHKHISLYGDLIKPLMYIEEYENRRQNEQ